MKKQDTAEHEQAQSEAPKAKYRLGLIGNANTGKTTLYNSLTHSNEHVGNWHGVTNDIVEKNFSHRGVEFCLADLPGIYSLTSFSMEEIVSRNYLLSRDYDMIINIVDANNLARNLYLTTQMLEMNVNLVLAVNMIDELNSFGKSINVRHLEAMLKVPVVGISAKKHSDVHMLVDMILDRLQKRDREGETRAAFVSGFIGKGSGGEPEPYPQVGDGAEDPMRRHLFEEAAHRRLDMRPGMPAEEMMARLSSFHERLPHDPAAIGEAAAAYHRFAETQEFNFHRLPYLDRLPVRQLAEKLSSGYALDIPPYWAAIKVLEKDRDILEKLALSPEEKSAVDRIADPLGDSRAELARERYLYIDRVMVKAYSAADETPRKRYRGDKIDAVVLNKYLAIPVFLLLMLGVFFLTFGPYMPGTLINQFFDYLISLAGEKLTVWLTSIASPAWVVSLVGDALLGGLGGVLPFLPQIVMLFLALTIMEDTGYLSRVAFALDGLLNKIGLNGRSVFSLLMGFGCSATAMMTTRSMEEKRAKIKTAFLIPYMSCTAKMPIYITICAVFFVSTKWLVIFGMYLMGVGVALAVSVILQKTKLRGKEQGFIMEMPPYRVPSASRVANTLWKHTASFLVRVGTVIFSVVVIGWVLVSFNWKFQYLTPSMMDQSILASVGKVLRYLFVPIGLGTWQATVAILTGIMGKEAVVGTLGMLYPDAVGGIASAFSSPLNAFVLMTFCLLYVPCIAAMVTMKKEIGGKWTAVALITQMLVAYALSGLIYWIGRLFLVSVGGGVGLLIGIAILAYAAFWFPKLFTARGACIGCDRASCSGCGKRKK